MLSSLAGCGVEWHAEHHESIGKTLHTDPDRSMAHVGLPCFRDGVVVDVDDAVQVECDNLSNVVQLLEVVLAMGDKGRERDGREVADRRLIWGRVLDDSVHKLEDLIVPKFFWFDLADKVVNKQQS
jgi:hypothetical protein